MQTKTLSIFNKTIRTDADGRFCLNDLHKAAMDNDQSTYSRRPANFLKSEGVSSFICEVEKNKAQTAVNKSVGRYGGTYAVKEVAIEYLRWLGGVSMALEIARKVTDFGYLLDALESFEVPDDLPDMFVYAIRESETGRIKIGISRDPEQRLKQLQIGNSQKLEIVATKLAANRFKDEKLAHIQNSTHHIRSEWFDEGATIQ